LYDASVTIQVGAKRWPDATALRIELTAPSRRVSVVMPSYGSQRTIARCLESLARQTLPPLEIILVDSGPDTRVEEIVLGGFPQTRLLRSEERLLPHDARNHGVAVSSGDLVAFTDPDIYLEPDWLARLVAAHEATGAVIAGALVPATNSWRDRATHMAKLDIVLPGGPPREIALGASGNLLCRRDAILAAGGFPSSLMIGDAVLCLRLRELGHTIWFEPSALGRHDHPMTLAALLRDLHGRGRELAAVRLAAASGARFKAMRWLALSVLPLRLFKIAVVRAGHNAFRAGRALEFFAAFPVLLASHSAWLAGEIAEYGRAVVAPRRPTRAATETRS
jgi:glycosyltransferase involved in cell wall biosynthesis